MQCVFQNFAELSWSFTLGIPQLLSFSNHTNGQREKQRSNSKKTKILIFREAIEALSEFSEVSLLS